MDKKKLTKSQQRKADARKDYEKNGLSVKEIAIKYDYKKATIESYISKEGWQKLPSKDLQETKEKAKEYLSVIFNEDMEELKRKLFGGKTLNEEDETSDRILEEIDEIQNLATVMMSVAKGNASVIEKTFMKKDGELEEMFRSIKPIRPDPRAGAFYLELSEKLATMVDIGEFETDEELEERYKEYYEEKLKKQREEFANRVIDE